jgi:hypothetical protein
MVDINTEPMSDGWVHPLDYLDMHFPGDTLHRYVQAHVNLDHMRGLSELLSRRKVRYVWLPAGGEAAPRGAEGPDAAERSAYDRLCRGDMAGVQVLSPASRQDPGSIDRYWLEGLSVVAPSRDLMELSRVADGVAPTSYMLGMDYQGVRVLLAGQVRSEMWPATVRDRGNMLRCTILYASHPLNDAERRFNAQPYGPGLDLMRPSQVVLSTDPRCETEVTQAYRDRRAEVISLDRSPVVILRIDSTGKRTFECGPAA